MSDEKMSKLISKLQERTNQGRVAWEETSVKGTYQVAFPGYTVQITSRGGEVPDTEDYILSVLDGEGAVIESASDTDPGLKRYFNSPFRVMAELYKLARGSALGVDTALNKILEVLDEDLPF